MEATSWSVTEYQNGYSVEHKLFTYSEEEQEENKIARETASMVLNPKFIPLYPKMLQNWFSMIETAIYGFIDFFLSNNNRFYCTDEQIAKMLWIGERSVSSAIKKLKDEWIIVTKHRIKWWWWTIRFIEMQNTATTNRKICDSQMQNVRGIENKIIENKNITIHEQIEFEEFRMKYPNKKWKSEAMKKRNKMTAEEKDMAYKSIDLHQKYDISWNKDNGRYIPYWSTYLNQKRREDEIDESKPIQKEIVIWEKAPDWHIYTEKDKPGSWYYRDDKYKIYRKGEK